MKKILLIGMSGCGKSTVGLLLAQALGCGFLDTDVLVEEREGCSIPTLFDKQGEVYFRDVETAVALSLADKTDVVIATGGGIILRPENMESLSQEAVVIFLDRDIEVIIASKLKGRPLFADGGDGIRKLYTNRIELYRNYAEYIIPCGHTPEETCEHILSIWKEGGHL